MRRALDEDAALIASARQGDTGAYAGLVVRYQEIAFRTAYLILGDAAEAEDAAQEAFINAYYALGRFRAGSPFRPWLLRIVANAARNRRKASTRREALSRRAASIQLVATSDTPEVAILEDERRQALVRSLEQLREEDRLVIACRYLLELSEEETASALGCPRGTVKSRLARALGRLRAALATDERSGENPVVEAIPR
jgi:RNA polymerase sigma-70 factor (ECF subfamily)